MVQGQINMNINKDDMKFINIVKFLLVAFLIIVGITLGTKQTYAGWTDLNSATGVGSNNLKAAGISSDGQTIIIVGYSGFIKTSSDGGTNWTDRNAAAGAGTINLRGADIGPSGEMLVVGDGFVKTSTNGGVNWTDRAVAAGTGATQVMNAAIGPSGEMLIVGLNGYSRVSTNGGANWANPNFTTFHLLNAAIGPSGQMIAAATDQLWTSVDGVSWTDRTTPAGVGVSDIYGAAIGPSGQMIAAGTGNGYLRTSTDGGANWTNRTAAAGVQAADTLRGAAVSTTGQMAAIGANGFFKTSSDGGVNWDDQNANSGAGTTELKDLVYGPSDSFIVVGASGFVKKYTSNSSSYPFMSAGSVLGGGVTDCYDTTAAPCPATGASAAAASQTQINVSWSAPANGPATTSYDLVWCTGASCTPSTTIAGVTSAYAHTGRTCNTVYGYQIIAKNAAGSATATATTYATTSACASAPSVTTNAASNPTVTGGQLNGTFAMNNGTSNQFWFRYGTSNVACTSLPSATTATGFASDGSQSQTISGLTPNTTYYFCAAASNSVGTTYGSVTSFTTSAASQIYTTPSTSYAGSTMVVTSDNMPVIMSIKGLYKCNDTSCSSATLRSSTYKTQQNGAGKFLTLDTSGIPVGVDYANNQIFKCTTIACSAFTTAALGSSINGWASVAIPSDNFPIVAYNDGSGVSVVKCTTATCSSKNAPTKIWTGTPSTDPGGASVNVIIGGDNLPLIAFGRDNYGVQVIHCGNSTCTSGNASTLALQECSGGTNHYCYPGYISLAKASDGFGIFVAETNYNSCGSPNPTSCQLYVYKCANAACTSGSSTATLGTNSVVATITVPSDGKPLIGWGNYSSPYARITKCGNTTCSSGNITTGYLTTGGNQAGGDAIGVDSNGIPFYHYDIPSPSAGYVIKCANATCN